MSTAHVTVLIKQAEVRPAKSMLYRKTMWKFPSQLYLPKSPSRSNLVIPKYNDHTISENRNEFIQFVKTHITDEHT